MKEKDTGDNSDNVVEEAEEQSENEGDDDSDVDNENEDDVGLDGGDGCYSIVMGRLLIMMRMAMAMVVVKPHHSNRGEVGSKSPTPDNDPFRLSSAVTEHP
ncbi:hypothetical protein RRG08_032561 [Elysia crispata]|uniref:Uncharacterized protein n=1 Tax=Elysia crispata TaxID=231223 RepID=A0AAE0ZXD6_9GAST|nr:hypothetical protein RRG08_032561 [Elysia crispata]